ncbi:protein of unknown function [Methylocaldum szegediense]|uniref:Uncharacterized protein n=1 Tax=Methylocaldum szegediense TaxID=73780 RepID=A0ABN8WZV4_9GAMM|nr:protein of unknown function [Methylocaldum szegediense]
MTPSLNNEIFIALFQHILLVVYTQLVAQFTNERENEVSAVTVEDTKVLDVNSGRRYDF